MSEQNHKFKRIMLKISGEALGGPDGVGIDTDVLNYVCAQVSGLIDSGVEVAIVMGAGNFFRGAKGSVDGMDRVTGDQIGMVATIMNALALRDGFRRLGREAIVLSAIGAGQVAKIYSPISGRKILSKGRIVLCAGGTGNPFLTTDTAAVLRALELKCDVMLKATKVDGVYDRDPVVDPSAVRFEKITYDEVMDRKLRVMDLTAVTLARDENLPMVVFNMNDEGAMKEIVSGNFNRGTLITR